MNWAGPERQNWDAKMRAQKIKISLIILLPYLPIVVCMSPVSPVFHTVVTASTGLKNILRVKASNIIYHELGYKTKIIMLIFLAISWFRPSEWIF